MSEEQKQALIAILGFGVDKNVNAFYRFMAEHDEIDSETAHTIYELGKRRSGNGLTPEENKRFWL